MNYKDLFVGFFIGCVTVACAWGYCNRPENSIQYHQGLYKGFDSGIGWTLDTCNTILRKTLENTRKDSTSATRLVINDTNIYILSKKALKK